MIGHGAWVRDGAVVGRDCTVGSYAVLDKGTVVGDRVRIQSFAYLVSCDIGDDVFIGPRVTFTNDPAIGDPKSEGYEPPRITVESGARIAAAVTLLPGITVGAGARIGAGSVVTKDVPKGETWYGNPARCRSCGSKTSSTVG